MTEESGPHIVGQVPEDNDILWRYMDFHQLYDLLTQKQLTFVSPDFFEDKLEGHYSQKTFEKYMNSIEQQDI